MSGNYKRLMKPYLALQSDGDENRRGINCDNPKIVYKEEIDVH